MTDERRDELKSVVQALVALGVKVDDCYGLEECIDKAYEADKREKVLRIIEEKEKEISELKKQNRWLRNRCRVLSGGELCEFCQMKDGCEMGEGDVND